MPKAFDSYVHVGPNLYRDPKTKSYYARVKIKGVQYPKPLLTTDPTLAKSLCSEWVEKMRKRAPDPASRDVTIAQVIDIYIASLPNAQTRKDLAKDAKVLKRSCPWEKGADAPFLSLTPERCKIMLQGQETDSGYEGGLRMVRDMNGKKKGDPMSDGSFNKCFQLLDRVCHFAFKKRYCCQNPMDDADLEQRPLHEVDRETPSLCQFNAIIELILFMPGYKRWEEGREEAADMIKCMGFTGFGNGEIEALKWGQFHQRIEAITLTRIKTKHEFSIPIMPWSRSLFDSLRAKAEGLGGRGTDPETPVFNRGCPTYLLGQICKLLGFPHFSFRGFRRFFVFRCFWGGVPAHIVAKCLGHQDGGKLVQSVYDQAKCADKEARLRTEMKRMSLELAAATSFFGVSPEEVPPSRVPEEDTPDCECLDDEDEVAAALVRAKAIVMEEWEALKKKTAKGQFKRKQDRETVVQGELVSIVEAGGNRGNGEEYRKARREKNRQSRLELIEKHGLLGLEACCEAAKKEMTKRVGAIQTAIGYRSNAATADHPSIDAEITRRRERATEARHTYAEYRKAIKLAKEMNLPANPNE